MRSNSDSEGLARNGIPQLLTTFPIDLLKIYPRSFCFKNEQWYGLIRTPKAVKLAVLGARNGVLSDPFQGDSYHHKYSLKICDLSEENTNCLMGLFSYTKPTSLRSYPMTIGFGDQLGLAITGFLRTIRKFEARPVLTRSVEENGPTETNANQVVPGLAWSIFQENYQEGYGADRNPLDSIQDVKHALDAGASVITLDLSEKINPEALRESEELINRKFRDEIDEGDAKVILHLFLDKEFLFKGPEGQFSICFDEIRVKRNTLLFYKALDFAEEVYEWTRLYRKNKGSIDFGISLEKTPFPTSPENHFFLALELSHRGVHLQFFAPQFSREFRDSINLNEDQEAFREQFYRHLLIAEDHGYRISIQEKSPSSLSDIGGLAKGLLHLRLSDLSWLEAMRLIALFRPALYRESHSYSLSQLSKKSKLQHALQRIPEIEELSDEELSVLPDQKECREFFHIAFEDLLHAAKQPGEYIFRNKLYDTLNRYEEDYWSLLEASMERDLSALGVKKKTNLSTEN